MIKKLFATFACAAMALCAFGGTQIAGAATQTVGGLIDQYYLSDLQNVKNRTAGSDGELCMAQKLDDFLAGENFEYFDGQSFQISFDISSTKTSQNVVGVKNNGKSTYVILGAHYDCVYNDVSFGYSDNLSGVIALMNTALMLQGFDAHNVIVAFWGAEEVGCLGSNHFVQNLPQEIKQQTLLYVNFDSVGAGDYRYYYTNDFQTPYANALNQFFAAKNIKQYTTQLYATNTQNGVNYTTLGMQSDNSSFLKAGINSLNFFAGNVEFRSGLGFFETKYHPRIMHTTDTKTTIDQVFGQQHFEENITWFSNATLELLSSNALSSQSFFDGQINPSVFSDVTLKICGVIFVVLGFGIYLIVYLKKYKKIKI